jgi:hypothetical protein
MDICGVSHLSVLAHRGVAITSSSRSHGVVLFLSIVSARAPVERGLAERLTVSTVNAFLFGQAVWRSTDDWRVLATFGLLLLAFLPLFALLHAPTIGFDAIKASSTVIAFCANINRSEVFNDSN